MITIEPPSSLPLATAARRAKAGVPAGEVPAGAERAADGVASALRRSLREFLPRAQAQVGLKGQVAVLLTDDAQMRRLNRRFRGKHKSTDVLSFPAEPMPGLPEAMQTAGDLAISLPIAAAQAERFGHPLTTELRILVLHGLLHLAGFDHETDLGEMAEREAGLRRALRLPDGLIGRTVGAEPGRATATPAGGRRR